MWLSLYLDVITAQVWQIIWHRIFVHRVKILIVLSGVELIFRMGEMRILFTKISRYWLLCFTVWTLTEVFTQSLMRQSACRAVTRMSHCQKWLISWERIGSIRRIDKTCCPRKALISWCFVRTGSRGPLLLLSGAQVTLLQQIHVVLLLQPQVLDF